MAFACFSPKEGIMVRGKIKYFRFLLGAFVSSSESGDTHKEVVIGKTLQRTGHTSPTTHKH